MTPATISSFGKIAFVPALGWMISTQPHVALRLKRIFPKISPQRQGWLQLSDTPENAREIEWFLERYPHQVEDAVRRRLKKRSREHREKEALVARMLAGIVDAIAYPMAEPPRPYQITAAELWKASGGLLLADDLGSGKSITAITAIVDPRLQPALIVCYPHLTRQFLKFFRRFAPHLNVHILQKGTPYDLTGRFHVIRGDRLVCLRGDGLPQVMITNYEKLTGWAGTLSPLLKSVVWDECQELRHPGTNKYFAAKTIADAVEFRMGASHTPMHNYGIEMWNVYQCIDDEVLGSREEFSTEWCGGRGEVVKQPRALGSYLRRSGTFLRRTRKELKIELPPAQSIVETIETDSDLLERETVSCADLARTILAAGESRKGRKMQAAGEFDMRLRQATGIAKAPYVAAFVRMLLETGDEDEKVLVACWHRRVYDILMQLLAEFHPTMYTGSETPSQKARNLGEFISGKSRVMLMSLRAGAGTDGIQQACSLGVVAELDWCPAVHEQFGGRLDRDGQLWPVFLYFLVAEEGSDPTVADVAGVKAQQLTGIRDPDAEMIEELQLDPNHVKKLAEAFLKGRSAKTSGPPSVIGHPVSTEEATA